MFNMWCICKGINPSSSFRIKSNAKWAPLILLRACLDEGKLILKLQTFFGDVVVLGLFETTFWFSTWSHQHHKITCVHSPELIIYRVNHDIDPSLFGEDSFLPTLSLPIYIYCPLFPHKYHDELIIPKYYYLFAWSYYIWREGTICSFFSLLIYP